MLMQCTLKEYELLLEAFVNWIGDAPENWRDDGRAWNLEYQALIDKLKAMIAQREG